MGSGKIALGKTMIGIGIGLCVLSFFLIVLSVSAWFWLTGIGGCILIGTGLHVKDDGEWEVQKAREIEEALWDKQYNDPKWRKNKYYQQENVKYKIICELFARKQYKILGVILKKGR